MIDLKHTFKDYQLLLETHLSLELRKTLDCVQHQLHHAVILVDNYLEIPDLILKISQLAIIFISLLSSNNDYLIPVKEYWFVARNFTYLIKGLKPIEGILNLKTGWKFIVLNISGMILFIIVGSHFFKAAAISSFKIRLAVIPVFGVLPWGGLFSFALLGFTGMIALFSLEKRKKLEKEETYITTKKGFWSQQLDLSAVQTRYEKYQAKVIDLKQEIDKYKNLIQEGKEIKSKSNENVLKDSLPLFACRKTLEELSHNLEKSNAEMMKYKKKASQWGLLAKNWSHANLNELENYHQAKLMKWKAKLEKLKINKQENVLTILISTIAAFKEALILGSVVFGYGSLTIPLYINIGLKIGFSGSGIAKFFMKRSREKINVASVDLEQHLSIIEN